MDILKIYNRIFWKNMLYFNKLYKKQNSKKCPYA
jgi:YesN/AraC family two-component response regulator